MIGPGKSRHCQTWLRRRFSWNENLQRNRNWTANLRILEKILEMSSRFLPSEQPCEPKSLDVALNIAGVEKICFENFTVAVNTGDHWIRVLNERNVSDREIGVVCCWWFSNQFGIVSETPYRVRYSRPWAVVSYTLFAAVLWNGLEHSRRKARL